MAPHPLVTMWPDDLRYADGDVVLRFSDQLSRTLVLHHDVLARHSKYFKALFNSPWRKKKFVTLPSLEQKEIWELDLYFDGEIGMGYFMGEGSNAPESPGLPLASGLACHQQIFEWDVVVEQFCWNKPQPRLRRRYFSSPYAVFWTSYSKIFPKRRTAHLEQRNSKGAFTHRQTVSDTLRSYKALFTYVYGKELEVDVEEDVARMSIFFANILRLADHCDLLEAVSKKIEVQLLSLKGLWADIATEPRFCLIFGAYLKCKRIMRDALKHGIGQGSFDDRFLDDYFHILPPDICVLVRRGCKELADTVAGLNASIAEFVQPYYWNETRYEPSAHSTTIPYGMEDEEVDLPAPMKVTANLLTFRMVMSKVLHHQRYALNKSATAIPCDEAALNYTQVYDSARWEDFETINPGWLPHYASMYGFEEAEFRGAVNVSLSQIRNCFDESPLFVKCSGHDVPEDLGWGEPPEGEQKPIACYYCDRRQERAEHETSTHFTLLALHHHHWLLGGAERYYPHQDDLGYPVNKDGWPLEIAEEQMLLQKYPEQDMFWGFPHGSAEEKEFKAEEAALEASKQPEKVTTKPASSEWLQLLGVGLKHTKVPKAEVPSTGKSIPPALVFKFPDPPADDLLCALAEFNASIDKNVETQPIRFWGWCSGFIPCLGNST